MERSDALASFAVQIPSSEGDFVGRHGRPLFGVSAAAHDRLDPPCPPGHRGRTVK